jgi:hypothetical protein
MTNMTLTIAPSERNAFAADLALVFSSASMLVHEDMMASVASDAHEQTVMTVINIQNGIRLSGLPSLREGQNTSIYVYGLQNALLRGDSGSFSLTLVLGVDESRLVDKCEGPNRAIWAPDQELLFNLICPASFYSDTLLKLGIYSRRCLACPKGSTSLGGSTSILDCICIR